MARENLFKPGSAIVNKVLLDEIPDDDPCPAIAKPENMARAANRLRQRLRPEDPWPEIEDNMAPKHAHS